MTLEGKGFFIWKIPSCEGGSADAIAAAAQASGFTHVIIKIADGTIASNYDRGLGVDLVPPVAQALRSRGLHVWGWHYVYGSDPLGEARIAIQRIQDLNLEGYVIDAESEYKQSGKATAANKYMNALRNSLPTLPFALSSYRFPSYHRDLPWSVFLEKCDLNMPQVYWEQSHNPGSQLTRSVQEFQNLSPRRPVIPTGPSYKVNGWAPTESDTTAFLDTALSLGLSAANFFSWDECRRDLNALWKLIGAYHWPGSTPAKDITAQYIDALNAHDPNQLTPLYNAAAVHITATRTAQGTEAICAWYTDFLNRMLPNGKFTLTSSSISGTSRNFSWQATSTKGKVLDGSDTFGLMDGKISYHYTSFSITPA